MRKSILFSAFIIPLLQLIVFAQAADFENLPVLKWKFRTGAPIIGSPLIIENAVYFGSTDSNLYAVNFQTGKELWRFSIKGDIRSTAAADNNKVFFTGGDGNFYALDITSGKEIWHFSTEGEAVYKYYSYADYYHSSPVILDGKIYFGSGDGNVYSLDAGTGKLLWSYKTGDVVHSSPCIYGENLYIGSFDGYVYCLNSAGGNLVWKFKSAGHRFFPKGEMQGSPAAAGGLIFIGSRDYNLYAIDAEKGYCHWNRQFPMGWALAVSPSDSTLFAGTSDDDVIVSFDAKTGKENWRTNVKFNTFGSFAISDKMLYFGTLQGKLFGLNKITGGIKWVFKTDGYNENRNKYFPDEDNIVKNDFYAIVQSPEGYIAALHKLGAVFSTPVIKENCIIFTSTDGNIYCLEK